MPLVGSLKAQSSLKIRFTTHKPARYHFPTF